MALIRIEGREKAKGKGNQEMNIHLCSKESQVKKWLEQCYEHPCTSTKIGQSTHIRSLKGGFQLQFKEDRVETAFIYFRTAKMDTFEGYCYLGINKGWNIKGAVYYLGEPPVKNKKMMEVIYPHLGLGLVFQGMWSNELSLIDYAYVYQKEGNNCCAGCAQNKNTFFFACRCKLVQYCSEQCYRKHYGNHLIFCDSGVPK